MAGRQRKYSIGEIKDSEILSTPGVFGKEEKCISVEGMKYPVGMLMTGMTPDPRKNLPKIKTMDCRNDDIYLCAFMKAGTHWVWEICSMLVRGKEEYLTDMKTVNMLEFHYPEEFDNTPSPRILNTHLPFRLLPNMVQEGTGKILFVQRNPKDVVVSSYHHIMNMSQFSKDVTPSKETFNHFVNTFCTDGLLTDWFGYTNDWYKLVSSRTDLNIHVVYYEHLKKDIVKGITDISKFLGTNNDAAFIEKVAHLCTFKNMKHVNEDVKDTSTLEQEKKLLKNIYRKGEVGDWKNWFTVAQNEQLEAVYAEKMKECGFSFTYTLD